MGANDYEKLVFENKIEDLKYYYNKNQELTIIGLNDLQGVNTTTLFGKVLLEFIVDNLKDDEIKTTVINAFSLMFNKTEHINYLLKSNPSLDEIKKLQVYGMVKSLEKATSYIGRALYRTKKEDKDIKLTDTLKNAKEPIVIYSSGANDLMRECWNNPFKINKDYKKQNNAYKYALDKLSDVSTTKGVIDRVESNINNILSLNDKADIFTLGLYIPKSMQNDGMKIFNDAIERYNEFLKMICDKYNIEYVDTKEIAECNNKSEMNFYVTTKGHYELANEILEQLHRRKTSYNKLNNKLTSSNSTEFEVNKYGLHEMLVDLKLDLNKVKEQNQNLSKREQEISKEKQLELERQIKVVEKVLVKRKNYLS